MTLRVLQVVVTENFAGAERHVANLSRALAEREDCAVTVVGGSPELMPRACGPAVEWFPGSSVSQGVRTVSRLGRFDVCHVHMTYAEVVGLATRPWHRAPVIATRHFAKRRGSSWFGRLAGVAVGRSLATEIATSHHVADAVGALSGPVIHGATPDQPLMWREAYRTAVVLQRLEREKDTELALEAWRTSALWTLGWALRIVGDGSQRQSLEDMVRASGLPSVTFAGWLADAEEQFSDAGLLIATCGVEALGLSALEAMAAGVPVIAPSAGGYLETVGQLPSAPLFEAGNPASLASILTRIAGHSEERRRLSRLSRELHRTQFSIPVQSSKTVKVYRSVRHPDLATTPRIRSRAPHQPSSPESASPSRSETLTAVAQQLRLDHLAIVVSQTLTEASVPHVVIKGCTTSWWLYAPPRRYSDVDVLVPNRSLADAVAALVDNAVVRSEHGRLSEEGGHSLVLTSDMGAEVDLHVTLPSLMPDRTDRIWEVLAQRVVPFDIDGRSVPALDIPGRCVVLALHLLASGDTQERVIEDFRRAQVQSTDEEWRLARELARRLGLEMHFNAAEVILRGGSPTGLSTEVALRLEGAPSAALQLERMSRMRLLDAAMFLGREVFPSPEFMRRKYPHAARSRFALVGSYGRRIAFVLRSLPESVVLRSRIRRRTGRLK